MIISLSGKIDDKLLSTLLEGLNSEGPLKAMFTSTGGYISTMEAIIHLLREESDRIELVGYGELYSAAFVTFFEAPCTRTLLPSTIGMAHLQAATMSITQSGEPRTEIQKFNYQQMKIEKEEWIERHRLIGLNDKELKRLRKGEDVYFPYSRMLELLLSPGVTTGNAISAGTLSEKV